LELGDRDEGCPLLQRAIDAAEDNFEVQNQATYLMQRCPAGGAADDSPGRDDPAARGSQTVFSVQVAAVRSAAAADEMMQRLHREGYQPHVVRDEDGLLKVRVGRFPRRAQAEALLAELRSKIGGSPFVVEGS
jgi:cell division septation protein DedD